MLDRLNASESDTSERLVGYFRGPEDEEDVPASPEQAVVIDVPEASRYELRIGERVIGFAAYHRRDDRIAFTHTEIDESGGRGFGSRLVAAALDDVRRQGLEVAPLCPFVASYIEEHPEYQDLVAARFRERS